MEYKYLLVENQTTVLWGPMFWNRWRTFQSELDDLDVVYQLPPVEQGYIKINDNLEIFPLGSSITPDYDPLYEQLVGPFYTYVNNEAHETYTKTDIEISAIKSKLKSIVASKRYDKEVAGAKVKIQGTEVTIDTGREGRNIFVQQLLLMPDAATTKWKFPETWLEINKTELGACVAAGVAVVQGAFDWEGVTSSAIDAASTIDALKAIVIVEPLVRPTGPGA